MSLQTDRIFIKALSSSEQIYEKVEDRIYPTTIAVPEKDMKNEPLPYIAVEFVDLTNQGLNKDSYEGDYDQVDISVVIAAETREDLADLAELARTTIQNYFENIDEEDEDADLVPLDYEFTASAVKYDDEKPCFWQILSYDCDTKK